VREHRQHVDHDRAHQGDVGVVLIPHVALTSSGLRDSEAGDEGKAGNRVVEVAGLDRADARVGLTDDVAELAAELSRRPEDVSAT